MNDYVWTPSGTDITERWRQMGWMPPSELPAYQQKWSSYKELPLRSLTDQERLAVQQAMSHNVISYPWGRR
jgi:hypothetical protein